MPVQADVAVLSSLRFLLSAGGMPLIASGSVFGLWAIWNVFKPPQERWILAQVVLSLIPGVIALVTVYATAQEFTEIATSEEASKPAAIAAVAGRAMSYGFSGLLSTLIPVFLGAVGLLKKLQPLK